MPGQKIQGTCPHCGRTEDGVWYEPCPADDCPSNEKEHPFEVTLNWKVSVVAKDEDEAIYKASKELQKTVRGSDYAPFDCWSVMERKA